MFVPNVNKSHHISLLRYAVHETHGLDLKPENNLPAALPVDNSQA